MDRRMIPEENPAEVEAQVRAMIEGAVAAARAFESRSSAFIGQRAEAAAGPREAGRRPAKARRTHHGRAHSRDWRSAVHRCTPLRRGRNSGGALWPARARCRNQTPNVPTKTCCSKTCANHTGCGLRRRGTAGLARLGIAACRRPALSHTNPTDSLMRLLQRSTAVAGTLLAAFTMNRDRQWCAVTVNCPPPPTVPSQRSWPSWRDKQLTEDTCGRSKSPGAPVICSEPSTSTRWTG